jgi:hypothetical protein
MRPHRKNNESKKGSSSKVPAQQAQVPELIPSPKKEKQNYVDG